MKWGFMCNALVTSESGVSEAIDCFYSTIALCKEERKKK